jgi:hypothetical protein
MRADQLRLLCVTHEKLGLLEARFAITQSPETELLRNNARLEAQLLLERALYEISIARQNETQGSNYQP